MTAPNGMGEAFKERAPPIRIAGRSGRDLPSGVNFFRSFLVTSLAVTVASCATAFRDDSHYVAVSPKDGYYLLEKGGPLALQLGYANPPTFSSGEDADSYTDIVAFRFDSAGVLSAPPGYFAEFTPDPVPLAQLTRLRQGITTWAVIQKLFDGPNQYIKQADGGMLVYHEIRRSS
jgi:hypothetical protein